MFSLRRLGHNQYRLGMILAFGSMMCFGSYNAFAKGLTAHLTPMTLLIVSELLMAAVIVVTFGFVPLLKEAVKLPRKTVGIAIAFGFLSSAIVPMLWFTGLTQTTAVNASVLNTADLIAVIIFGYFLLGERITVLQEIGAGVILAGILVVNLSGAIDSISVHRGDLLILLATQLSGLSTVLFKKYLSDIRPELTLTIRAIAGGMAVLGISLLIGHQYVAEISTFPVEKLFLLLAFVFFSRYMSLTMFYESLERLPMTTVALIQIGEPLFGMMFGAFVLGESIEQYHMAGAALIMAGLFLEQTSMDMWRTAKLRMTPYVPSLRVRAKQTEVAVA